MKHFSHSSRLHNISYDIRGPVLEEAHKIEEKGHEVLHLNVGNTAPFGVYASDILIQEVTRNIKDAQGYSNSIGIISAQEAIQEYYEKKGLVCSRDSIYIGNGVSELIQVCCHALMESGDEVLVPSPNYPLWTAAIHLSGGKAVHYLCDELDSWQPSIADIRSKITARSKALVVINPNNPTGAVYSRETLRAIADIAREHNLLLFADEIYDQVVYDDAKAIPLAHFCEDIPCVTMGGLSKVYRLPGFRTGWMAIHDPHGVTKKYREGIRVLLSMRLCSNVPGQLAIPPALRSDTSIKELTAPQGALCVQRDMVYEKLSAIPGISCVKPKGAMYVFFRIDVNRFHITDDETFVLDLLKAKHILLVHGRGFHWAQPDHARIVFLPNVKVLQKAIDDIGDFLSEYRQQ